MVTVDGVMQGLGGRDEDRRGGFERGGWVGPLFDDEASASLNQVFQRADAFLFGRRTYEIFARSWGSAEWRASARIDLGSHAIAGALNSHPNYVASTTLTQARRADTTLPPADVPTPIRGL